MWVYYNDYCLAIITIIVIWSLCPVVMTTIVIYHCVCVTVTTALFFTLLHFFVSSWQSSGRGRWVLRWDPSLLTFSDNTPVPLSSQPLFTTRTKTPTRVRTGNDFKPITQNKTWDTLLTEERIVSEKCTSITDHLSRVVNVDFSMSVVWQHVYCVGSVQSVNYPSICIKKTVQRENYSSVLGCRQ